MRIKMSYNRKSYEMREFSGKDEFKILKDLWGHLLRIHKRIPCYVALPRPVQHYLLLHSSNSSRTLFLSSDQEVIYVYSYSCVHVIVCSVKNAWVHGSSWILLRTGYSWALGTRALLSRYIHIGLHLGRRWCIHSSLCIISCLISS